MAKGLFAACALSVNVALHVEDENVPAEHLGGKLIVPEITLLPAAEGSTIEVVLDSGSKVTFENKQTTYQVEGSSANIGFVLDRIFGRSVHVFAAIGQDDGGNTIQRSLVSSKMSFTRLPRSHTAVTVSVRNKKGLTTLFCEKPPYQIARADRHSTIDVIKKEKPRYLAITAVREPELSFTIECFKQLSGSDIKKVFMPHLELLEANPEGLQQINEMADIFQVNEREAKKLLNLGSDKPFDPESDFEPVKEFLNQREDRGKIVVVTLGSKGAAYVAFSGKRGYQGFTCPPYRIKAIDSTGSGDVFLATLLWALSRNFSHGKAVQAASFVAAKNAERVGGHAVEVAIGEINEEIKGLS